MEGYCVKCRKKKMMKDMKSSKTNGRTVVKGVCTSCGTKMAVFTK